MWSSKPHEERHIDIACRRSTPNSIDDEVGQGLGEVNVLLEQRFSQPVAPPPSLTWEKVERLVMTAPAPEPVLPWWRTAIQPGYLAMASATAAIAIAVLTSVPIFRTSVPALEGTVYARGGDGSLPSIPPPSELMPQWNPAQAKERRVEFIDDVHTLKRIDITATHELEMSGRPNGAAIIEKRIVVPEGSEAQELPVGAVLHRNGNVPVMKIIQTQDLSTAELVEEVRKLNLKSDGDVSYTISVSENTLEQRITGMQKLQEKYGGEAFLPGVKGRMVISQDGQTKTIELTADELEHMVDLDMLMRRELERLNAEQAASAPEASEGDADSESSAPRTTGRQK